MALSSHNADDIPVTLYDEPRVSQIGETVLQKRSETKWA